MLKQSFSLVLAGVLTALASAPAQSAAPTNVHINRTGGTCPASIVVDATSMPHPGGATLDVTARTMVPAFVSELVSATPAQLEFHAMLRPAFASCEGAGTNGPYHFTLHAQRLTFVIHNTMSSGQFPRIVELDVNHGNPHVTMQIAD